MLSDYLDLPFYLDVLFYATVVLSVLLWKNLKLGFGYYIFAFTYLLAHSFLALFKFYHSVDSVPPRIGLIMFSIIAFILITLKWGNSALSKDTLIKRLILFHIVRIPVEICLDWLYHEGVIPKLMTFEGRNFDILIGLSAPLIYWLNLKNLANRWLILWNIIGLALVSFVLINGALSAPSVLQQFAFGQPNIAVLYFPYVLLPCFIVPAAIYCHIKSILLLKKSE